MSLGPGPIYPIKSSSRYRVDDNEAQEDICMEEEGAQS